MAIKKVIKDYFIFSGKERTAAIILLVLIGVFIALPYLIKVKKHLPPMEDAVQKLPKVGTDSGYHRKEYATKYAPYPSQENSVFEPFNFDPNTIDEAGWHKLGLRDKTIHTILNYRNKGGQFREADDIKKIWGLRPEEANRILPYVQIKADFKKKEYAPYHAIVNKPKIVDINTATVEELRIIPGMGNGMVYRMLKYKERLGGFLSIDQVKETYGMNDSSLALMLPFFKLNSEILTKININTATDYDLSSHPYISKDVAKAIVLYRIQHGNYKKVEDIKLIVFIKETLYQKIAPYLSVQ